MPTWVIPLFIGFIESSTRYSHKKGNKSRKNLKANKGKSRQFPFSPTPSFVQVFFLPSIHSPSAASAPFHLHFLPLHPSHFFLQKSPLLNQSLCSSPFIHIHLQLFSGAFSHQSQVGQLVTGWMGHLAREHTGNSKQAIPINDIWTNWQEFFYRRLKGSDWLLVPRPYPPISSHTCVHRLYGTFTVHTQKSNGQKVENFKDQKARINGQISHEKDMPKPTS